MNRQRISTSSDGKEKKKDRFKSTTKLHDPTEFSDDCDTCSIGYR